MKINLSIPNIAWEKCFDDYMYAEMSRLGFTGLEIAPTRIFNQPVYEKIKEAADFSSRQWQMHGIKISSMQSIWHGVTQQLFGADDERQFLLDYTKKAIDFASAMSCRNLVFGCPKNRSRPLCTANLDNIYEFFAKLGDYTAERGTVLSLEANPAIYGTNFINTTLDALDLVKTVSSKGFRLNLDIGAAIYNEENIADIRECLPYINHVHVSEPNLVMIEPRALHKEVIKLACEAGYAGYFSIEMQKHDVSEVIAVMQYLNDCKP